MQPQRQYQIWCRTCPLPGGERWRIAAALCSVTRTRNPYSIRLDRSTPARADLTISERRKLREYRALARRKP